MRGTISQMVYLSYKKLHIANFRIHFFLFSLICSSILYLTGCERKPASNNTIKKIDYIRPIKGKNDSIPNETVQKGKVLISYSDCYICHKEDTRSVGPAFRDIAKRYPSNKAYIEMLAHRVILGGSGSWGYPIMDAHPTLSLEDGKMMVSYILSRK